jgi:hypothetical protein
LAEKFFLLISWKIERRLQQVIDSFPAFRIHREFLDSSHDAAMLVPYSSRATP